MNNEYYDMGFKDGFKKALRESNNLNEARGGGFPPNWNPTNNPADTAMLIIILRQLAQNSNTAFILQDPRMLAAFLTSMGMSATHIGTFASYLRGVGNFGSVVPPHVLTRLSSRTLLRSIIPAGGSTATGITVFSGVGGLAAAAAFALAAVLAFYYSDEISTGILELLGDFEQDIIDSYADVVDIDDEDIRVYDPNKPKIDPQGGVPPMKAISPGDPGYDDISNQAGGPAYPRYPRGR